MTQMESKIKKRIEHRGILMGGVFMTVHDFMLTKNTVKRCFLALLVLSLLTGFIALPVFRNSAHAATVSGTSPGVVIAIAQAEVGYLEKASNSQLYDKTANSGSNNWNKYAADIDKNYPNFYNGKKNIGGSCGWCDIFVDWCFIQAYGYDKALQLLCQPTKSTGAGPSFSMKFYKNAGQFGSKPMLGAQVFIKSASHTGLVVNYDNTYVYSIEGNWGNAVKLVKRKLTSSDITGYGYPGFSSDSDTTYEDKEIDISGAVYPSGNYGSLTNFGLRGIVTTSGYLTSVEGSLYNLSTKDNDFYKKVSFTNTTTKSHNIQGPINDSLIFGGLTGYYEYQIVATYVVNGETKTSILIDSFFTIGNYKLITSLSLKENEKILPVTGSYQLSAEIAPSNASRTTLEWESADTSVATVSSNGVVKAVAPGATDIYCRTTDGTNLIATCHISVPGQCGDQLTWGYSNNTLTISGSGAMYWYDYAPWYNLHQDIRNIEISSDVTGLGSYAFSECTSVSEIVLPQGLNSVGTGTFASCTSLKEITIPASLKQINTEAFINCSGLTKINFPDSLKSIGWGAFSGCSSLITIDIPESVYDIQSEAFKNCSNLQAVKIPETIQIIGNDAFEGCPNVKIYCGYGSVAYEYAVNNGISYVLTSGTCGKSAVWSYNNGTLTISGSGKITDFANVEARPWHSLASSITTVVIEPGITHIGEYCFESFTSLTSVTIPNTVTYMAYRAFYNCDSLQNISLPNLLTGIGSACFMECGNLQSIYMPDTVTTIGYYTFKSCTSLADVHLSTQLSAITYGSFADCSSLSNIVIPDSVTKIGYRAFEGCQGLWSITIPSSVTAIDASTNVGAEGAYGLSTAFSRPSNLTVYCFDGSVAHHYAAEKEIAYILIDVGGEYTIADGDYIITSAVKPRIILDIYGVDVPAANGTTVVICDYGEDDFVGADCDKWTLTYLNNGFYSIKQYGTEMALTVLGNSKERSKDILVSAYSGAAGQQWAIVPTPYGYRLKARCSGFSADIQGGVNYIKNGTNVQQYSQNEGENAQNQSWRFVAVGGKCGDNLNWRKDGKELTISGTGAMYDYTYDTAPWGKDITSVSFSEGVTSIGHYAFYGCSDLRSVSGHPSITSIGTASFEYCSSLPKFNIGTNVKEVGVTAFAWCSSLTYVSIPASVEYIGEGAFCYCESLETIMVDSTNNLYYTDDSSLLGKDGTLVAYLTTRTAESYTIPDGIKRIGAWCFANAKNIKTLTVPSSVVEFGHGAVENSGLITIKCFEDSTAHTFAIENNIQYILMDSPLINPDLVLPAGTKYIEEEAFAGIAAKRVRLPEGITEIEANAFANCLNLKQIYIPEGCEWIATNAFSGVSNLTIYGASGSYAEWYASRRGFEFVKVQ